VASKGAHAARSLKIQERLQVTPTKRGKMKNGYNFHNTYFERFALELFVNFVYVRNLLYKYGFTYAESHLCSEIQVPKVSAFFFVKKRCWNSHSMNLLLKNYIFSS
jgi:hypothetical protein